MYKNLRKILEQRKFTNKDLASLLETSEKTVSNKMNGRTDWTLKEIMKISKFLAPEYTLDYLFEEQAENTV